MLAVPCSILQGMAPDEYRCEKLLPFFYAKGSTVLILANLAEGNSVNPVFLAGISYLLMILTPGLGMDMGLTVFVCVSVGLMLGFCMYKELVIKDEVRI
jgi:hypothetical protein